MASTHRHCYFFRTESGIAVDYSKRGAEPLFFSPDEIIFTMNGTSDAEGRPEIHSMRSKITGDYYYPAADCKAIQE